MTEWMMMDGWIDGKTLNATVTMDLHHKNEGCHKYMTSEQGLLILNKISSRPSHVSSCGELTTAQLAQDHMAGPFGPPTASRNRGCFAAPHRWYRYPWWLIDPPKRAFSGR